VPRLDHGRQFLEQGCARGFGVFYSAQFIAEAREERESLVVGQIPLVGEIIGCAGKAVDELDRFTQARRHEHGRNGKIFVVVDSHAVAGKRPVLQRLNGIMLATRPVFEADG
jgi:hypothetical protein